MTEIQLTPAEILKSAFVGIMRHSQNLRNRRSNKHGAPVEMDWQMHIDGALGECALAKYLNVYWAGKGEMGEPDVGGVDVRTTDRPNGRLILHPDDDDDRRFYLLVGINGRYEVRGSILGRYGKRDEFWTDPTGNGRPAYFVPQSALEAERQDP